MFFKEVFANVESQSADQENFAEEEECKETNRLLQSEEIDLQGLIGFTIKRGSYGSEFYDLLKFKVTLTEFNDRSITFQVEFENPLSISAGENFDKMSIKILEPSLFVSKENGLILTPNNVADKFNEIFIDIPKQFSGIDAFENI